MMKEDIQSKMHRFIFVITLLLYSTTVLASIFDSGFNIYEGDHNNDGLTDFYFHKPDVKILHGEIATPVVSGEREGFILVQNYDQTFSIQSSENTNLSSWTLSSVMVNFLDFNIDGIRDIIIKNVSNIIPGAHEQIVIANPVTGGNPIQIRAVDEDFQQFFQDIVSWMNNPSYFYQDENFLGYDCVEGYWAPEYGYYFDAYYGDYAYGLIGYYPVCTEYAAVYDGSKFNPLAIQLASNFATIINDNDELILTPGTAESIEISNILEEVLTTVIYGQILINGGYLDFESIIQNSSDLDLIRGDLLQLRLIQIAGEIQLPTPEKEDAFFFDMK